MTNINAPTGWDDWWISILEWLSEREKSDLLETLLQEEEEWRIKEKNWRGTTKDLSDSWDETTEFPRFKNKVSEVAEKFLSSIENHKSEIMSHYPNLTDYEYNEIAKRAIWILYQESEAGASKKYGGFHWIGWKEWILPILWIAIWAIKTIKWEERSRWYTQIKFNWLFDSKSKQILESFWIKSWSDLTDAWNCWIATMIWLIDNYFNFIVPMKKDPFWTNDAKIIEVKCNDWKIDSFAIWKKIPESWTRKIRTMAEIQKKIEELWNAHRWIAKQEEKIRLWIKNDNEFFDFLYYTWNKPSEITYWTATPNRNKYVGNCRSFTTEHIA